MKNHSAALLPRYRLLAFFPKEPEKRAAAKDLWGEMIAIEEYKKWLSAGQAVALAGGNMEREEFFDNLGCEVDMDSCIVEAQFKQLAETAPAIGQFEFLWLDSDGGTIRMEEEFRRCHDILEGVPEEERGQYELLRNQCRDPVAAFEYEESTHWGRGDPEWLLQLIQRGHNI